MKLRFSTSHFGVYFGEEGEGEGGGRYARDLMILRLRASYLGTRTRTNTNPNGTEANAAGRSGNARALRKQSKCGMIQEG